MSAERLGLLVCGLCLGSGTALADEPAEAPEPEAEFLEYLGMWEDTDEEWLLHDGLMTAENEARSEPVPDDEDSPEMEDES